MRLCTVLSPVHLCEERGDRMVGRGNVPLCVDVIEANEDVDDETETGGGFTKLGMGGLSGFPRSFSPMLGRSRMTGVQYCVRVYQSAIRNTAYPIAM